MTTNNKDWREEFKEGILDIWQEPEGFNFVSAEDFIQTLLDKAVRAEEKKWVNKVAGLQSNVDMQDFVFDVLRHNGIIN